MPGRTCLSCGFTLLELLVVIAIVALLLAMLLPSLSAAHEAGRAITCAAQLNQLFHGSYGYSEQHDDTLPYYAWMSGRPDGVEWWPTQIARGMNTFEPSLYACPSDRFPRYANVIVSGGTPYMADRADRPGTGSRRHRQRIALDITYRGSCDMVAWGNDPAVGRKVTEWERPEQVLQLVEGASSKKFERTELDGRTCFRLSGLTTINSYQNRLNDTWMRHFGMTNVLFLDGHIDPRIPEGVAEVAKQSMSSAKRITVTPPSAP